MNKFLLFLVLTLVILILSRKAVLNTKSHGFYRTFGWIGTLWILLSNYKIIFYQNSILYFIGLLFILYSLLLLLNGGYNYLKKGKHDSERSENHLFGFEKTSSLVSTGIYRYIRHPLYASLLFLSWGFSFVNIKVDILVVLVLTTFFYFITMLVEEKENIAYFGSQYQDYRMKTKMIFPFVI